MSIQQKVEEVKKAIRLLAVQGYTILDLEDNMINKWNIDDDIKYNIAYSTIKNILYHM